jgi:hypothetical protein
MTDDATTASSICGVEPLWKISGNFENSGSITVIEGNII